MERVIGNRSVGFAGFCIGALALSLAVAPAAAGCPGSSMSTADGCKSKAAVERRLQRIVDSSRDQNATKAAIARVDVGRSTVLRTAIGQSETGVPANPRMHFRIGSIAITNLTTLVLQLQDEGRLSLNDKLSRWFPGLPRADQITVKMLGNNTSGYLDYAQGNPEFIDTLFSDVFRQWTPDELMDIALARGFACDPGTCFNYAHTNYILLSKIVTRLTGSTRTRMKRRILAPLNLDQTRISRLAPMPRPVLHAYIADRGPYEDSTSWSPSWTIGSGTVLTSTIDDVAKAARPVFGGKLLSARSRRQLVAPDNVGKGGQTRDFYFGLGLLAGGGWRMQNPQLNGYTAISGYLPARKLTIAVTATNRLKAAKADTNPSAIMFNRMAAYLAPGHPSPISHGPPSA
ncbi:MAG: beta-lactamase family protein [Solirubrobacterales bacterium]|nr:beta-lactamase family protein [Solirubrobacterales bacterium]